MTAVESPAPPFVGAEIEHRPRSQRPSKDASLTVSRKRGARATAGDYLTFGQVTTLTGIGKYRLGAVVRRVGLVVYRSPIDRRRKYLRREDVGRLTGYVLDAPEAPHEHDTSTKGPERW